MADPRYTGTTSVIYPTDFNFRTLNLVTPLQGNGVINLLPFLIELNLFEDLYSSTISGEIVLQDAVGLIAGYTFNGTEFLQVELQKTASDDVFYSRNFRVYKINKRVVGDSNDYEVFSLVFCSEEFLISEQYRISKSFRGEQISNIVERIMTDYLMLDSDKKKPVNIEQTYGNYDFILPNKKIFETINWLSTYARTPNSDGDMLFFENSKGYNFISLSTLFSGTEYGKYKFDPKNISDDMNQKVFNVTDFEVLNFYDTLAGVTNGTFANKTITLNVLQRVVNRDDGIFNYNDYVGQNTLNPNPIINNYKNRLGGTMYDKPPLIAGLEFSALRMAAGNKEDKLHPGIIARDAVDSVANDINIEKYLPNRAARLGLANYTRLKFTIPGDPNMCVGRVIYFSMYRTGTPTWSEGKESATRPVDELYTGRYLVTAVRHIVKYNNYITIVEVCKDSNVGQISGFDNGSALLKNFVDGIQA